MSDVRASLLRLAAAAMIAAASVILILGTAAVTPSAAGAVGCLSGPCGACCINGFGERRSSGCEGSQCCSAMFICCGDE